MRYNFDWNPVKEQQNIRKHGINFRKAATVFHDPNQLSVYDEEHSEYEERWITIGLDSTGVLRVVVHRFEQVNESECNIYIISARKAISNEARKYGEGNL